MLGGPPKTNQRDRRSVSCCERRDAASEIAVTKSSHEEAALKTPGQVANPKVITKETAAVLILPVAPGSIPAARGFSDSSHCRESLTL